VNDASRLESGPRTCVEVESTAGAWDELTWTEDVLRGLGLERKHDDYTARGAPFDPWTPIEPATWERLREAWPDGDRLARCWALATSVAVLAALIRGERVPVEALDAGWVRRYGFRDGTSP
jgi:hypothetical protein